MQWFQWRRWLPRRSDDDFGAEIEAHITLEVDRLLRGGMSPEDARFAARRAFGNPTAVRERFHDSQRWSGLESLAQDVRHGLRGMRRTPGFTAIAVASLAIGIGANTTMFGAVDALLVRTPAHVRDAAHLHRVYFEWPNPAGETQTWPRESYRTYLTLRDQVRGLEAAAAFWAQTVSSGRGLDARPVDAVLATPSMFTMLGVSPALGRFFAVTEERDEGDHVVVLGYDMWRGRFNGDSSVLGRTIDVAGTPYIVIGVAPEGFTGVDLDRVDLWLPLGAATRLVGPRAMDPQGGGYWLEMVVRRRKDAPVEQVASEVTRAFRESQSGSPRDAARAAKTRAILAPVAAARGPAPSADAQVSVWVAAVSLLVLLIACANVANLLLLRGLTRSREVAVRLSLGASRWRVMRLWLVEGALLAVGGALCALVLARWSAAAVQAFLLPRVTHMNVLDPRLLAFTTVVALGTGLLASLIPALMTARRDSGPLLGASRPDRSPNRLAVQRTLVAAQVALATLLLVGSGLFVMSLRNVRAIDLGVDVDHVLYVQLNLPSRPKQSSVSGANTSYDAMVESVRRVPGVTSATLTAGEPLASGWAISLVRRGTTPSQGEQAPFARAVGQSYFETMATPLRRGRLFNAADHMPNAHVAIVDEATARRYWPGGDALDPCVYLGSDQNGTEIVGVVASTVLWEVTGDKGFIVYVPLEAFPERAATMMEVRTAGDPEASIPAVRQAVLSVSPDLPWVDIEPMSKRLDPQLRSWRLGASMFTVFGLIALCLAAVGLYGLLSYLVTQRSHEIGIRKALGAPDGGVVRLVLRGALGMTLAGLVLGVAMALGAGRLIASQVYGISPRDPTVIALGVATLAIVAIVASLAPARRATRVDPMVALRSE